MLPPSVAAAIAAEFEGIPRREIAAAAADLSDRYRSGVAGAGGFVSRDAEALAYIAVRMPATHGAIQRAMVALSSARPGLVPTTLLDLGAGPGTAAIAAASIWPGLEQIRLLDADPRMSAYGRRLLAAAPQRALREAVWTHGDLSLASSCEPADMVSVCYVLSELSRERALAVAAAAWELTAEALVIVGPGTIAGFALIRAIRDGLVRAGATVAAPCPQDGPCPMGPGDWCHFAARIPRSRLHREIKGGSLGYEDEPFSYVVLTRTGPGARQSRVLRSPVLDKSSVGLTLCTPDGIMTRTVPRSDRTGYREARRLTWGAAI